MSDAYIRVVQVDGPNGTGDFTISASGETATPVGIILFCTNHGGATAPGTPANQAIMSVGVSDGTTEAQVAVDSANNVGTSDTARNSSTSRVLRLEIAGGDIYTASALTGGSAGPTSGGWVINVSSESVGGIRNIVAWLFFGSDMQCYSGIGDMSTQDTAVTQTPGFQIHGGLFGGVNLAFPATGTHVNLSIGMVDYDGATITQRAYGINSKDNVGTSEMAGRIATDGVLYIENTLTYANRTEVSNITSTQFDLTARLVTGVGADNCYLVWNVGDNPHKLESIAVPTSTGVDTLSTENCANGVFGVMSHATAYDTKYLDGNAGAFGVFGADSVAEYSLAIADEDAQSTSDTQSMYDAKIFNVPDHTGAAGIVGTVDSLGASGLDVNYTAVEGSANQGFLYSIGQAAPAAAATSGGGRILPPVRKKKPRKTITLKREPKVIPQEPDKVVDLSALIEITESLAKPDAKSEDILPRLADVIAFIPKEGEKREGGEVTAQEAVDSLLLKLAPILKEMDDRVSAVSSKVEASESSVDQLKILVAMEREEAQKEQLVVLLMQLVVLLS